MVSDARVRSGMEVDPWLVGFNLLECRLGRISGIRRPVCSEFLDPEA